MNYIAPAFRIPLAKAELAMLGELCAIQGQVEHLLVHTLHYVLDVKLETARTILASSSIETNLKMWIAVFREKCSDQSILDMAESAASMVKGLSQGRNDFVHAIYATPKGEMWLLDHVPKGKKHRPSKSSEAIAVRTRDTKKKRAIGDLIQVRNDAARLSVILNEIANEYFPGNDI
jgi:hypothetical protein